MYDDCTTTIHHQLAEEFKRGGGVGGGEDGQVGRDIPAGDRKLWRVARDYRGVPGGCVNGDSNLTLIVYIYTRRYLNPNI